VHVRRVEVILGLQDLLYVDAKLRDLAQLADDAYQRLDAQAFEMQRNITELEATDETHMTDVRACGLPAGFVKHCHGR
jgi:hypothetical protein